MVMEPLVGTELVGTISEFIDYARLILSVFVVYYIIRLFTVEGPTAEEKEKAWNDRGAAWGGFVKDKLDEKKISDAKKGKALALARAQAALTNLLGKDSDDAFDALVDEKEKQFNSAAKRMNSSIRETVDGLRAARHKVEPAFAIGSKIATMETVRNDFKKNVMDKLPKTKAELVTHKTALQAAVNNAKNDSSTVLSDIHAYIA